MEQIQHRETNRRKALGMLLTLVLGLVLGLNVMAKADANIKVYYAKDGPVNASTIINDAKTFSSVYLDCGVEVKADNQAIRIWIYYATDQDVSVDKLVNKNGTYIFTEGVKFEGTANSPSDNTKALKFGDNFRFYRRRISDLSPYDIIPAGTILFNNSSDTYKIKSVVDERTNSEYPNFSKNHLWAVDRDMIVAQKTSDFLGLTYALNIWHKVEQRYYPEIELEKGKTEQLTPRFLGFWDSNVDTAKCNFSSSDDSVATVDEKGVITGIKEGTATITAKLKINESFAGTLTVKVKSPKPHAHAWEIMTNGSTATIRCTDAACPDVDSYPWTAVISASSKVYDGKRADASLTLKDKSGNNVAILSVAGLQIEDLSFTGMEGTTYSSQKVPTEAGNYQFAFTVSDGNSRYTISTPFQITKAESKLTTEPKPVEGIVPDGQAQELVTAGEAEGGTLQYALGTDAATPPGSGWLPDIPKGTESGTYYVWYKVTGDSNHMDTDPVALRVAIGGEFPEYTLDSSSVISTGRGQNQKFIIHRSVDDDTTFGHFLSQVKMDGTLIPESEYEKSSGSLVITLKSSFLDTRAFGEHEVEFIFDDGKLLTKSYIEKPVSPDGTYIPIVITVSGLDVAPVPYRNGVSVADRRRVIPLGGGKYQIYADAELYEQYYFIIEPMPGYIITYINKNPEVKDRALNGGSVIISQIPVTGDILPNLYVFLGLVVSSLTGIVFLKKKAK